MSSLDRLPPHGAGKVPQYDLGPTSGRWWDAAAVLGPQAGRARSRSRSSSCCRASRSRSSTRRLTGRACCSYPVGIYVLLASASTSSSATPGCSTSATSRSSPSAPTRRRADVGARRRLGFWDALPLAHRRRPCRRRHARRRRRCACAATTSPSSRSGSARSSASPRSNSDCLGEARGITGIPHPPTSARPRTSAASTRCRTTTWRSSCIILVILIVARARAQPGRAGLGGHPRGRGRGRADGRARRSSSSCGRSPWARRSAGWRARSTPAQGRLHHPRHLPAAPVDPVPRRRRARRARQHRRASILGAVRRRATCPERFRGLGRVPRASSSASRSSS